MGERVRYLHYSFKIEKSYRYWMLFRQLERVRLMGGYCLKEPRNALDSEKLIYLEKTPGPNAHQRWSLKYWFCLPVSAKKFPDKFSLISALNLLQPAFLLG